MVSASDIPLSPNKIFLTVGLGSHMHAHLSLLDLFLFDSLTVDVSQLNILTVFVKKNCFELTDKWERNKPSNCSAKTKIDHSHLQIINQ